MVDACHGIGRAPCQFMLVGSTPGYKEMLRGTPFVGPTGEEVDRLLALIGFPRALWFLTNFFRRPAPRIDNKEMPRPGEDYEIAGHHLKLELARVQPKLIVPLGREAIRYFLGDVDTDEVWGLHLKPPADVQVRLPMLRKDVTIAPQVHPASGFHSPEASNQVLRGFELLARILKGKTPARYLYDDPIPEPNYRELFTADEFYAWANDYAAMLEVANDTEGTPRFPWSVQLTKSDGEGIILRTPEAMGAMHDWARETRPTMTFHNALYDVRMNRVQGLDIFEAGIPFDDTQLIAYELGVIPQGLKALAVRECAMPMLGYKEVLGDAQDRHARAYLQDIWNKLNVDHQRLRQWDFEFQTRVKGRRIKKLPTIPKHDLMKTAERVLSSKEPARLWLDQTDDRQVEAFGLMRYEMPEASLSDVDPEIAIRYAGRDPDATRRVKKVLYPRLQEMGLEEVYRLDLATLPILDRMMSVGMLPDHDAFSRLALVLDDEIDNLRRKLIADTGINNFNPNSGDQTASYIFDNLGLDMLGKRTDSGRGSTNDKVLEALEKMYPEYGAIADIRQYREYYKLRWTFVERLPEMVDRWPFDGRIHCELMLTRTPSGRLAAKNPNLLAMPKHGKYAKLFRACFVPRDGCMFVSADESQVELRGLAHLSQDPVMCAIFRGQKRNPDGSAIDLHAATAQRIFGVAPKDQDDSKHRLPAKAVNFGIPMGMTKVGLCLELQKGGVEGVTEDDAQRWIDETEAMFAEVPVYKQAMIAEAEKNGYVRCFSGRIRYVGGIRSRDDRVRAEAERFAFSTPIQEIAQAVGKRALAKAWRDVYVPEQKRGHYVQPLLWTHDDLLSEIEIPQVLRVAQELKAILTEPPPGFSIPLQTTPEAGLTWADLVKL